MTIVRASAPRFLLLCCCCSWCCGFFLFVVVAVNLDCGWTTGFRDPHTGTLITNATAFPSGMKDLGDALHARGLKFGIYGSASKQQCCSRQIAGADDGSVGHEKQDAELWASFGVDYLK